MYAAVGRRRFLALAGIVGANGLSGCQGPNADGTPTAVGTPAEGEQVVDQASIPQDAVDDASTVIDRLELRLDDEGTPDSVFFRYDDDPAVRTVDEEGRTNTYDGDLSGMAWCTAETVPDTGERYAYERRWGQDQGVLLGHANLFNDPPQHYVLRSRLDTEHGEYWTGCGVSVVAADDSYALDNVWLDETVPR